MTVDLQVFSFKNKSFSYSESKIVDWGYTGFERGTIVKEVFYYDVDSVEKIDNGKFLVRLVSEVLISCFEVHKKDEAKDTFYSYHCQSEYVVNPPIVDNIVIAELFLSHHSLSKIPILQDTLTKSNGQSPYSVSLPSLSKIILHLEASGFQYKESIV